MTLNRLFGVVAVAAVIGGLALAFIFLGTPAHQRLVEADAHRVRDLDVIARSMNQRYAAGGLPARLPDDLFASDPNPRRSYSYRPIDAKRYELCATFDTNDSVEGDDGVLTSRAWRHGSGLTCYRIDARDSPPAPRRD